MKKVVSLLMILMLVLVFVSCDSNNNSTANNTVADNTAADNTVKNEVIENETTEPVSVYPVTITDGMGREVIIESEPTRIISMTPSMTEFVYVLGLGDKLIGRTDYCTYPEAASSVESIGSLRTPNVESIIAMDPDIILISTHASEEVLAKLEEAGLTVAVLTAQESFDGVYDIFDQMAMIFDVADEAAVLKEQMKSDVNDILTIVQGVEKKSVYYVVGFGEYGEYTATGETFIHQMLEMAGGTNIAADGEGWSYNLESIIEKDPMYILCSELNNTKSELEVTMGYKDLTAVKEGRLIEINQDLLSRQGPRLAEGLKAIAQILHPELFE